MLDTQRLCPRCNKIINYSTKLAKETANRKNSNCRKCAAQLSGFSARFSSIENSGDKNPFFGKKHTKSSIDKIKNRDKSSYQTPEFKQKISKLNKGNKNPMFGRSFYQIWINKYGLDEANKRLIEHKNKKSIKASGKNNSMYGKPAPKGSGMGWKGWYNDHYFRSLRELCYMIELDENKISWISGETLSIPYKDWRNHDRTYRPDFIVNKDTIVEIKPKKMFNTPQVQSKLKALEEYAKSNNFKFKLIDVAIDTNKIEKYLKNNSIVFSKNYLEKFKKWKEDHK